MCSAFFVPLFSDAVGPQPHWDCRSQPGVVHCIHKCSAVCKHSHIHSSSESQGSSTVKQKGSSHRDSKHRHMGSHFPRMSQRVSNGGSDSPNSHFLPSPPCPLHFKLRIFSLPWGPEKGISSHIFQGDMGCFYLLSISSFL